MDRKKATRGKFYLPVMMSLLRRSLFMNLNSYVDSRIVNIPRIELFRLSTHSNDPKKITQIT
jgi:hypothetical protein